MQILVVWNESNWQFLLKILQDLFPVPVHGAISLQFGKAVGPVSHLKAGVVGPLFIANTSGQEFPGSLYGHLHDFQGKQ